jgi:hypothetical protein
MDEFLSAHIRLLIVTHAGKGSTVKFITTYALLE